MIFSKTSNYMLKYQKAKAKLVEYGIPKKAYPKFPLNSNELSYPVVYILSRYAESVIENNKNGINEFLPHLSAVAQYFDAAVRSGDRKDYDVDFLLSGAIAFFLSNDYGSAKVLCSQLNNISSQKTNEPQKIILGLFNFLLLNREFPIISTTPLGEKICRALFAFFRSGEKSEELYHLLSDYRSEIITDGNLMEVYYVDLLFAIIILALSKSSWYLLPNYTKLDQSYWSDYLRRPIALRMLWPAQQLIGEEGILNGQSAIVQLPTGVGKTKSIELILRSSIYSDRATSAIIVAPLRALCNEIASELTSAFRSEASINQFSDLLEDDFSSDALRSSGTKIMICTPEKLSYIIHHQDGFLDEIGLFIFDEGHMFDDPSRGAGYELLISEIRNCITEGTQIILLSAVLSNAKQIQEWLLGAGGVIAADPKIQATPKTIGFASRTTDIHYYSDASAEEDFFVPNSIEIVSLKKLPRERTLRLFPKMEDAKDIAIYYAIKLCKNGAAAIFANRTSTVLSIINRIIDLEKRQYDLSEVITNSDIVELNRLARLLSDYYGEDYPYTIACHLGILPHYSNLPNGLRLAVEYAFRENALRLVVCTTTLAQGVNIPIKYLFMTSFRVARNSMQIRNFQNLIGRTARSGMHTEGSIIITDPKLFDEKENWKTGGNYRWKNCVKLFDKTAAEPCGSSILSLVQKITIDYETSISGEAVANYIIDHYNEQNCFERLTSELIAYLQKKYPGKSVDGVVEGVSTRKKVTEAIENNLCFVLSENENTNTEKIASDICKSTLAYFMANDVERVILLRVFTAIAEKIAKLSTTQVKKYARTMVGIDLSLEIEHWISENQLTRQTYTPQQLFEMVISFFKETHQIKKRDDIFSEICQMWIDGRSYIEMNYLTSLNIMDLEEICSKSISYELSFFIGSIIDIFEASEIESDNLITALHILQRRIKYGVKSETGVSICEKVFNDRFLANLLTERIGIDYIAPDRIIDEIKMRKDDILSVLLSYPKFFSDRIMQICNL